jgi:NADH-ubiquinone oxidoreductase chain 5
MAAPTPISALVHSSTLVTAGVYLIIRSEIMISNQTIKTLTIITSVLTLFIAATNRMIETDLKKIIALSTIIQIRIIFLIIAVKIKEVAFLHLIIHAIFKAIIFIAARSIIKTFETQDIRKISQIRKLMPTTALRFNISNMSICGLIYTSGFYSKDIIIEESLNEKIAITILTIEIIRVICSVIYSIKIILITNLIIHNTVKITNKKEKLPTKTVNIFITTHAVIIGNKIF